MKKLLQSFRNINFRKKVFIICLLVSLVPVSILGTFCYGQIRELLINREKTALQETLTRENNALDYKKSSYINAMNHILWNETIRDSLAKNYSNNYEMYLAYRDIFDPLFTTVRSLHSEINAITIYTDNPIFPHGNVLRPLSEIEEKPWIENALSKTTPFFDSSIKEKSLSLICQIYLSYSNYTTILVMDIDYAPTFHSLSTLFEQSYGVLLTDTNETPIYSYDNFKPEETPYLLTPEEIVEAGTNTKTTKNYVIEKISNDSDHWNLYLYRLTDTISAPANEITKIVVVIIFCCIFSVIILSTYLSRIIVRPLELLVQNMKQIEKEDISVTFSYHATDEIGDLMVNFQSMVKRLHYLIDEVLKSKILQQEYEMRALQAQINPHFLYNSLSLINGKALIAEQSDISEMAQLLSSFYRTTLNRGKNMTFVKDELENIRSYINIQFIMHSNSFDVLYDIDEDNLPCTMINLLLQPLVENAIMHGIDYKETAGRGLLTISCRTQDQNIIFHIKDNGPGIGAEKLDHILTSDSTGYGIQNVHHRIQLFYGPEYGLQYESILGFGTTVSLTIPKKMEVSHES